MVGTDAVMFLKPGNGKSIRKPSKIMYNKGGLGHKCFHSQKRGLLSLKKGLVKDVGWLGNPRLVESR